MKDWHSRQPKVAKSPNEREIKSPSPENFDKQTLAWHFRRLDWEHANWGFNKLKPTEWRDLRDSLSSLEGLTWAALKEQCGGRGKRGGTNHHTLEIDELCGAAQGRFTELRLDDYEEVFSLRLTNTLRVYGIRDGRVFVMVWHDPHHGTKNAVYHTGELRKASQR
jgi:hypothetical protein